MTDEGRSMKYWWNSADRGELKCSKKPVPGATLFTTHPTQTGLVRQQAQQRRKDRRQTEYHILQLYCTVRKKMLKWYHYCSMVTAIKVQRKNCETCGILILEG